MKKVAIIQSSYIPWKGYFDIIRAVDEFVLLDDVQYTRRDWRNRNLIKTAAGLKWLTIPVNSKGHYHSNINEITIANDNWKADHWNTITNSYAQSPYFTLYADHFKELYLSNDDTFLSRINYFFIKEINKILGIDTEISWSTDYQSNGSKTQKLLDLCIATNADLYISGPSARAYLDEHLFRKQGIDVYWMNYDNYPEYYQLYPPFEHKVSILDLLFNEGPQAIRFMKSLTL